MSDKPTMLQAHLQDTYQYLFDTAHETLSVSPSLVPFGAGVRKTGEQIHTSVDLKWEISSPKDHISGLIAGLREDDRQSGLMAAGLVFDVASSAEKLDERALCFHLEAANGRAVQVMIPYARGWENRIVFGDPQLSEVPVEIFINTIPE